MRTRIGVVLAAVLAALFATAMAAGSANAIVAGAYSTFAEQGQAAGLTAAQTSALQAKADVYLAKLGGKQVALNQIDLNGAILSIALPGEAQPRALPSTSSSTITVPQCIGGADFGHFCAYRGSNRQGDELDMFRCGRYGMPFASGGSWDNNQTTGTRAGFYRNDNTLIHFTAGAHSVNLNADWLPVFFVVNC